MQVLRTISPRYTRHVYQYTKPILVKIETIEQGILLEKQFKKIQLSLKPNDAITDADIQQLNNITELNLWENNTITDNGIKEMKNITKLYLWDNTTITETLINEFRKRGVVIRK